MVAHRTPYDDGSHRNDEGAPSGPKVPLTPILHDAYDLMRRTPKPLQWLVPDIFPRYCIAVGADAKAGKTQLFATCALKIATSHPEVGTPPKVLIVAPDSTDLDEWCETINEKLDGTPVERGRLVIWTEKVPELGDGLIETVEAILDSDPAYAAVIVDVWNSVKPSKRGEDDVQKRDHKRMRTFAELAERRGIGVALLCHTNIHGQIAGSMGLRGGVHGLMMLEREKYGDSVAVDLWGRRIKGHVRFAFDLNELSVGWEPLTQDKHAEEAEDLARELQLGQQEREAAELRKRPHIPGPIERRMLDAFTELQPHWGPLALSQATGLRYATVKSYVRRMSARGQLQPVCGGVYAVATAATFATSGNDADSLAGNSGAVAIVAKVAASETHTPPVPIAPRVNPFEWMRPFIGITVSRIPSITEKPCGVRGHRNAWDAIDFMGAKLYYCMVCHPDFVEHVKVSDARAISQTTVQTTNEQKERPEAGSGADLGTDRSPVDALPSG